MHAGCRAPALPAGCGDAPGSSGPGGLVGLQRTRCTLSCRRYDSKRPRSQPRPAWLRSPDRSSRPPPGSATTASRGERRGHVRSQDGRSGLGLDGHRNEREPSPELHRLPDACSRGLRAPDRGHHRRVGTHRSWVNRARAARWWVRLEPAPRTICAGPRRRRPRTGALPRRGARAHSPADTAGTSGGRHG